jgi:hypothetical protein
MHLLYKACFIFIRHAASQTTEVLEVFNNLNIHNYIYAIRCSAQETSFVFSRLILEVQSFVLFCLVAEMCSCKYHFIVNL